MTTLKTIFILCCLGVAGTMAALPPGNQDVLLCPPGRCKASKPGIRKGIKGAQSMFKICRRNSSYADKRRDEIQEGSLDENHDMVDKNEFVTTWGYKVLSAKKLLGLLAEGYHEHYCGENLSNKHLYSRISWLKKLCTEPRNKATAGCRDLGAVDFKNIAQYRDEGNDMMDVSDQDYSDEGNDMMDESDQDYSDEGNDMMDESDQDYSDEGDDMMDESDQDYSDEGDDMMDESNQPYSDEGEDAVDKSASSYSDVSEDTMDASTSILGAVSEAKATKNNDKKKEQPRSKDSNGKKKDLTFLIVIVGAVGMVGLVIGILVWKQRNTDNQYESYYSTMEGEVVSKKHVCSNAQTEYAYENPKLAIV